MFVWLFTNKGGKLKTPSRYNSIKQKFAKLAILTIFADFDNFLLIEVPS